MLQVFQIPDSFYLRDESFLGTTLVTYLAAKMNTATNRIACKFVNKPAMLRVKVKEFEICFESLINRRCISKIIA